ncbi:MAG: toxin ParE1/3/4 [Planctomycetaceae bacterium]|jgi:toxin ParE1/3/4
MKQKLVSNKFKVTVQARSDLFQIGRYTELKWGIDQRNHYLIQLDQAFNLIGDNPKIGKDRAHVLAGYRSYQQGSHVIYYREFKTVEIIRVLHMRMDVGKHIQKT